MEILTRILVCGYIVVAALIGLSWVIDWETRTWPTYKVVTYERH